MDDTPRSNFATPRDDRFYTPRAFSNTNSSSDEWLTPRQTAGTSRESDAEYDTPRGGGVDPQDNTYNNQFVNAERFYKSTSSSTTSTSTARSRKPTYTEQKSRELYDVDTSSYTDGDEEEVDSVALSFQQGQLVSSDVEDIFSYARHGRSEEVERLLDRGIPVNVRDSYGNTILTIACQNGNKRMAKLALRRGADIDARNYRGNTPLHYCAQYGYWDSLGTYLIEKGADPHLRNNEGRACRDGT